MTPSFVLASASPARLGLLRDCGIEPRVLVSGVDEDDVDGTPEAVVAELARRKAHAVASQVAAEGADAVVLGCDSMLDVDGEALGKPGTAVEAQRRWQLLRGRSGILRTGHVLVDARSGRSIGAVASTTVHFGSPTDAEVDAYVASGEPLHVAGAFTLDGLSAPFVEGIEGSPSNVIGLCLPTLRRLLAQLDLSVTVWWS